MGVGGVAGEFMTPAASPTMDEMGNSDIDEARAAAERLAKERG